MTTMVSAGPTARAGTSRAALESRGSVADDLGTSPADHRVLDLARLLEVTDGVDPIPAVPTVDEVDEALRTVADAYPFLARRRRIGTSRSGDPLHVLSIGDGGPSVVVVGGLHPDDPVGGATVVELARLLVEDGRLRHGLRCTWHLVGCADPDATRLNEGWFAAAAEVRPPAQESYRPARDAQVSSTFPLHHRDSYFDRVPPETRALMGLLEETRPAFLGSARAVDLGGASFHLGEAAPRLHPTLHALAARHDLPLDRAGPAAPYVVAYDQGVFAEPTVEEAYAFAARTGLDPVASLAGGGSSMAAFSRRWGTFSLVSELPRRTHPSVASGMSTTTTYAELLDDVGAALTDLHAELTDLVGEIDRHSRLVTPYLTSVRQLVATLPQRDEQAARYAACSETRAATEAEVFVRTTAVRQLRLQHLGMLLRHLQVEVDAGVARVPIRRLRDRLTSDNRGRLDVPDPVDTDAVAGQPALRDQVAVHLGALLAAADYALHVD